MDELINTFHIDIKMLIAQVVNFAVVVGVLYKIEIPFDLRSYYWSLLENSLGFHTEEADWKKYSKRPVVVQFVVMPSTTPEGSYPTDIKILSHTNAPSVDAAVMYGISRRVFYNKSDRPIIGRMTYKFEN